MLPIEESGMFFGPFDERQVFHIEKSKLYRKCNDIKTVEFILHNKKYRLMFVEARSSSPIKKSGNEDDYEKFLKDITQKFVDSFHLYIAGILQRRSGHEEIGEDFKQADYQKMNFIFVLVIKGHDELWLPQLSTDLENKMRLFCRIWNSKIIVWNDELARE